MLLLVACADDRIVSLEAASQAQQARIDELETSLKERDARITELQGQTAELAARVEQLSTAPAPLTVAGDGRVTRTLSQSAAVDCARAELEGLMGSRLSYDAAFDEWGSSFEQIGWQPSNAGDCAANVAFSMGPQALRLVPKGGPPKVPMGVAVIVRGVAAGRAFAVDDKVRVYELPRVSPSVVATNEWLGGR